MKRKGLFALSIAGFVLFLFSCTKLNQPTELGGELLPTVDNVNTFDTTLDVLAAYHPFQDSSKHIISESMALGKINDPVFGTTTADMFFNLSSSVYGSSPFYNKDSVIGIDSVVLSLAYAGANGDTTAASQLSVAVSEITKSDDFNDTTLYRYDTKAFPTGDVLGTKTFFIPPISRDTITLIRKPGDTSKVINVVRIPLANSLGNRLKDFDTTATGAYRSDSLFRETFRGLAVKTTSASNPGTLAYFNLSSATSALYVYYRVKKAGVIDTATATFSHSSYSQANSIMRTAGGEYLASLNAASPQKLYIQSGPTGSYAGLDIPGLTNFPNKVIHRAELIAYRVSSPLDNVFTVPDRLLLDRKDTAGVAHLFDNDVTIGTSCAVDLTTFGGTLKLDGSYHFNLTRYVQSLVTRKTHNDSLRLYAPLRSNLFAAACNQVTSVGILSRIANGRVVLAGGNYPDPALRLRLRIIYSNL